MKYVFLYIRSEDLEVLLIVFAYSSHDYAGKEINIFIFIVLIAILIFLICLVKPFL